MMKLAAVMPVYNSGYSVNSVLSQLGPVFWKSIEMLIVLDNGSTDDSLEKISRFTMQEPECAEKVVVHQNRVNLGYGASVSIGIAKMIELGMTHILVIHSDDQTDWKGTVESLIEYDDTCEFVMASRFHKDADLSGYSVRRRFGNKFFVLLTRLASGNNVTDPGTAIVRVSSSLIPRDILNRLDRGYLFHPQLNLIILGQLSHDKRPDEVPLNWKNASVDNKFPLFSYGIKLLSFLLRYFVSFRVRRMNAIQSVENAIRNP